MRQFFLKDCTNIHIFDTVHLYSKIFGARLINEKQCHSEPDRLFKVADALEVSDEGREEDEPNQFEAEDGQKSNSSFENDASIARSIEKRVRESSEQDIQSKLAPFPRYSNRLMSPKIWLVTMIDFQSVNG